MNRLETLHIEAAIIVTGLPIFTKTENIYNEIGWETLETRRNRRKLQQFHNIYYKNAPEYLNVLMPPSIQSTTVYPLRDGDNLIVPFCRLSITSKSFFPSAIRDWNNLDRSIRQFERISEFKTALVNRDNRKKIPSHYYFGPRKLNIILTQLRCSASFLNYDLFRVNIIQSATCQCGYACENASHYFLQCPF